jgi:hypothetical protein
MMSSIDMATVPPPHTWHLDRREGDGIVRLTTWRAQVFSLSVQDGGDGRKLLQINDDGDVRSIVLDEAMRVALIEALGGSARA